MKQIILMSILAVTLLSLSACQQKIKKFEDGNISIAVETGEQWKHSFDLFWGITIKNTPQIAIWTEDMDGNYLTTIYVSKKIATQGWLLSGGNPRKEALPYWSHRFKTRYQPPTKNNPLPDAVTGATPSDNFTVKFIPFTKHTPFVIKAEFNHSTDFNTFYPESAENEDPGYSGGKEGSGQPAVVYLAVIDLRSDKKTFKFDLIGHSSPDGNNGELYQDLSTLTSAKAIVKGMTVTILE